jgi:EAL domain-containing protein (putative c-di-GMP-specific phosphodiesterase class I)
MSTSSQERIAAANPSQGRILVVDDEDALLRAIGRKLTSVGYDVLLAADGKQAVGFLAEFTFDAIFSDIDMPKMNGIELLQTVRQSDPDVPVVLMTGNPDLKTAIQAVELGAIQYLVKPFDIGEVVKVVSRAVRLNRMARLKREALALVSAGGFGESDRLALETSFDRALDTLWMAYQPIVRVADRSIFGYEALLRSEEKALPHPGAILDAAERLDRLSDLGRKIRKAACVPIPEAPPQAAFFVNLHARDLMDGTLLSPTSPLSFFADRVVLEITERASLDGITDVRAKIAELRRMGFRIAIDDLGAGYAGLTSFATLEPDIVKLDMSLVRNVDTDLKKEKVVRSMTSLAKDLGMLVVAEGVETAGEREALVAIGCDLLQGYLLAKPGRPFPAFVW